MKKKRESKRKEKEKENEIKWKESNKMEDNHYKKINKYI
jgi:hypothetical protein